MQRLSRLLAGGAAVALFSVMAAPAALADDPLMGKAPWNFQPQNRAAIAVAIKEVEDGGKGGAGGSGTTIVCGGTSGASGQGSVGSGASATANSSCIIVNSSTGTMINNPQDSDGDQDADSEVKTKSTNNKSGSIDEVGSILYGDKQGF